MKKFLIVAVLMIAPQIPVKFFKSGKVAENEKEDSGLIETAPTNQPATSPKAVESSAGQKARTSETKYGAPFDRVWIAVGDAGLPEEG